MSRRLFALILAVAGSIALQGCEEPGTEPRLPALEIELFNLPAGDTMRQTGIEFLFETAGKTPYRSVTVVVDPGSPQERSFVPDSAWRVESPALFPVVVEGPLPNGSHVFELRVEDADGSVGKTSFARVVHVPEVPYTLQFLGAGYDDSRAAGITADGVIAGTVFTGVSPTWTDRIAAWSGGQLMQPRNQPAVTRSTATGMNRHGEIVGSATVSGNPRGVLWRGDSLEILSANDVPSVRAVDITDDRRTLVAVQGGPLYFVDVTTASATQLQIPSFNLRMNGLGQLVGVSGQLYGTTLHTSGGLSLRLPQERPGRHERYYRGVWWDVYGVNDRGEVLGTRYSDAFLSHSNSVEYLAQRLPPGSSVSRHALSDSGDVAVLRGSDSVYVWRHLVGTRRLVFNSQGWKIDGLSAMNIRGQLVAHGVNAQTGQKGLLLLSPSVVQP